MCDLCGSEETQRAGRRAMNGTADRLEELAKAYREMSSGAVKPHTDAALPIGDKARAMIRELVSEWV